MKTVTFRIPLEVMVRVDELSSQAEKMIEKGYVQPPALYRMLQSIRALKDMCLRVNSEWWDDADVRGELRTRDDLVKEES